MHIIMKGKKNPSMPDAPCNRLNACKRS